MNLAVITCTGDRPEAFDLCSWYMLRQTRLADGWVVVDDGVCVTVFEPDPHGLHPGEPTSRFLPAPAPGSVTLGRNLRIAIGCAMGYEEADAVVICEDDDWYAPDYLAWVEAQFEAGADLVGDAPSRYYHVGTRSYHVNANRQHASLCATSWRGSLTPYVLNCLDAVDAAGGHFYDLEIWRKAPASVRKVFGDGSRHVGIKGMPGRAGIGAGHRPGFCVQPDRDLSVLREWIGDDADLYAPYYRGAREAA